MRLTLLTLLAVTLSYATTAMAHPGNHAALSFAERLLHSLFYSTAGLLLIVLPAVIYLAYALLRAAVLTVNRNRRES